MEILCDERNIMTKRNEGLPPWPSDFDEALQAQLEVSKKEKVTPSIARPLAPLRHVRLLVVMIRRLFSWLSFLLRIIRSRLRGTSELEKRT
jgi:hypothetical protein